MSNKIKLLILGEPLSGRTALSQRYTMGKFEYSKSSHKNMELFTKTVTLGRAQYQLNILDTGNFTRDNLLDLLFNGVAGTLLIVDLSRPFQEEKVKAMLDLVDEKVKSSIKMVVGTKYDQRVEEEKVIFYCREQKIGYIGTSAKTNFQVEKCFLLITEQIIKGSPESIKVGSHTLNRESVTTEPAKSRCC